MDSSSKSSPTSGSGSTTPTFVFRLVNFDSNGNKLGKRKYGYAAKTGFGTDLDETVYQGIISRAEQAFALRPQQYSVYLVLSGKRTKELGESDISAGSPFRIADFEGFKTYRNLMAAVQLDAKNRKVVNLCVVPLNYQFKTQTVPVAATVPSNVEAPRAAPAATNATAPTVAPAPSYREHVEDSLRTMTDILLERTRTLQLQQQAQVKACYEDQAMLKGMQSAGTSSKSAQAAAPVKQPEMPGSMPEMKAATPPAKQEATVNPQDTILKPTVATAAPVAASAGVKIPPISSPQIQPTFGQSAFAPYAPKATAAPYYPYHRPGQPANGPAQRPPQPPKPAGSAVPPSWPDWTRATVAATPSQPKYASPFAAAAPVSKPAEKPAAAPASASAAAPASASAAVNNVHPGAYKQPSQGAQNFYAQALGNKGTPAFAGWGTKPAQPVSTQTYTEAPVRKTKPFYPHTSCVRRPAETAAPTSAPAAKPVVAEQQKKAFHGLIPLMEKFVNDFNKTMAEEAADLPPIKLAVDRKTTSASPAPVLAGWGEKEPLFPVNNKDNKAVEEVKKVEEEVKHRATCDLCSKWIIGVRYKCLDCPDWDCCEKCFKKADRSHPDHSFVIVRKQGDIIWRSDSVSGSKSVQHYGVHCDSCNKPIFDVRYKCTHADCPDFDLCADCEADPVSYATGRKNGVHDYSTHHMLKIRKPISQFSGGRVARDALQQAIQTAQGIVFGSASREAGQANAAAAEPRPGLYNIPGTNDETLIVDVDVPYSMMNGKKEISISLDLGKNERGETVILGPSNANQAETATKVKVEEVEPVVKAEDSKPEKPIKAEEPVQEVKSAEVTPKEETLNATWVEDVTFDDGTAVAPGAVFNKIWKIKNTGSTAWPAGCQLIRVSGVAKSDARDAAFDLPELAAGESTNVVAKNVTAPDMPGKFMAYYRFVGPDGTTRFGDRLWLDVNVEEEEGTLVKSRNGSDHSLHSSSIVAPTLSVKNATDYEDISAVTSPRTAPSELPESEGFTASSVNGEDDDDEDDFVLLSDGEDNFAEIDSVTSSKN